MSPFSCALDPVAHAPDEPVAWIELRIVQQPAEHREAFVDEVLAKIGELELLAIEHREQLERPTS